ncbi:hypothetical protein BHE74_00016680 [Ensete ventricosum]|nr:hypothetical protein BHE74_00016680 [Ensete ventricosum]
MKVIAVGIAVGVGLHAISHLTCDFPRLLHATDAEYEPMKPFFGDTRPNNYWWFVKGTEGWTGVVMVVLMAIAFTLATPWFRRGRINLPKPFNRLTGFNAFWYSHHLFVIVYILFVVHGYFLYLSKKWYKKTVGARTHIHGDDVDVSGDPGDTVRERKAGEGTEVEREAGEDTESGGVSRKRVDAACVQAAGLQVQKRAVHLRVGIIDCDRHPFSITSAPQDDYISVHIRTLGDWTRQLKMVFSEVCGGWCSGDVDSKVSIRVRNASLVLFSFPRVLIDGPYGAPAQDYKKYEVVLLVGLGIGATPFISIVKDIVNNMKQLESLELGDVEEDLENGGGSSNSNSGHHNRGASTSVSVSTSSFRTRRAYFYWVTREQDSFEWFRGVMNEVAETDKKGVIELHNYCTSVYEEGDARSALIAMLQSLNHAKHGVDVVSGTRVKSHFARPNWRNVYKRIALNHRDKRIGVFYCGAPALTKELRQLAQDFSHKTATKFDFHKENF